MKPKKFIVFLAVLVLVLTSVTLALIGVWQTGAWAKGPKPPPTPTEILGNNLSVPVTFSEGYGLTGSPVDVSTAGSTGLRGTMLVDNFDSLETYTPIYFQGTVDYDGTLLFSNWFYEQKTEATWQAAWQDGSAINPVEVTRLDWGDSLLSQTWSVRSKIRVEVALYRDNSEYLQGYAMNHLYGEGTTEVWGTADKSLLGAAEPSKDPMMLPPIEQTVYSNCARITVSEITGRDGTVTREIFSYPVYEKYGVTGPGGFSGEVNVGGKLIYGFNWDPRAHDLPPGWYRVEFSLDPTVTWTVAGAEGGTGGTYTANRNVHIQALDTNDTTSGWPYQPVLAADGYSSYVDVELVARGGGGK
jgi:hypothetical protein